MPCWVLALIALVSLPSVASAIDDTSSKAVDDVIAELEKADPGSPEALNDRLEYAQYLVGATDVDCRQRLDGAQSQLDAVGRSPAVDVVLPIGRPRLTDIQYQIHLARASCGAGPAVRETELRAALADAQRAVEFYRDALDYQSMAVMQFDVGVTLRMLGDDAAAVAVLEAAIAMDREYGFRQETAENLKLLALWTKSADAAAATGARASPDAAAATGARASPDAAAVPGARASADAVPSPSPATESPARTTTLKFAWLPSDATLSVKIDHDSIRGGDVTHGSVYRLFKQHINATHSGWVVSYEPGQVQYDVTAWPSADSELNNMAWSFGRTLPLPGFEIGAKGDFKHAVNPGGVSSDQSAAVRALILSHTQATGGASRLAGWVSRATQTLFGRHAVEQNAAETYDLQTGVWIGAKLEQGVWYNMSAPLTLSGARQLVLPHDIEFAYTRDLPCPGTASSRLCVEIVVHATPQTDSIDSLMSVVNQHLSGHPTAQARLWSTTYMRIVTDPSTLTPYVYDERRYWHIGDDIPAPDKAENQYERLVATLTYP